MAKKMKADKAENTAGLAISDRKWEIEDDLRTLERAHEVIGDSGRLSRAKAFAKKRREHLDRISRIGGKKL